ncbi:hypothetical protein RXV91_06270 [Lactiplantibacillus sp. DA1]|uniref:hypothetical protein n=1 Tax=Lactiplantibacillus sp. DA1 TaxID=3079857 RepID=UPI00292A6473|nr:hypothetical protein [Lactiplantibacillus sp. DA1]MDV0430480.1 hypothetical protein [Lactiplantibacillus sp. DA1]
MEAIVIKKRWLAWLVCIVGIICVSVTPTMVAGAADTSTAQVTFQQTTASSTTNAQTTERQDTTTKAVRRQGSNKNVTKTGRDYQKNNSQTTQVSAWQKYLPQTDEQACQWLLVMMGLVLLILLLLAAYYSNKCERYQHSILHE